MRWRNHSFPRDCSSKDEQRGYRGIRAPTPTSVRKVRSQGGLRFDAETGHPSPKKLEIAAKGGAASLGALPEQSWLVLARSRRSLTVHVVKYGAPQ